MVEIKRIFEKYGINIEDENFYEDLSILLESAIIERVNEKVNERIEEEIEDYKEEIINELDNYSKVAIEEFINEHQEELEGNVKTELAEKFINSLNNTLIKENFQIPEDEKDIIKEHEDKIEDLYKQIIELNEELEEKEKESLEYEKALYFLKNSENLSESQKEKIANLLENMNLNSIEDFKRSFELLKENINVKNYKEDINENENINENINENNKETKGKKYLKYFYD